MGKPFFRYEYKGFHGCDCVCDLEIHRNLVIATERDDNEGTSIINMAEQLATEVCKQFEINPHRLIWVEHYRADTGIDDKENFSFVFFNLSGGGIFEDQKDNFCFTKPRWVSIEPIVVQALRETHQLSEPEPVEEWNDGKDDDEPYATYLEDRV